MTRTILFAIALVIALSSAVNADYYSDSKQGWWWYDRDKKQEETDEEKVPNEAPKQKRKAKKYPSLKEYTYEQVWDMDPAEFKELFDGFRAKAVRRPTENNVKEYYQMSEIARKKALAFTNTSDYVWQKYPELSVKADYPITSPGMIAKSSMEKKERKQVLQQNRDNFALVVFTKPGCSYCEAEDKILKWFSSNTGWVVKRVDITQQSGMAARFGITITPTLIMIQKGNQDYTPISAGVVTAEELEDRTYRTVRLMRGDTTPDQYSLHEFQRGGGFDTAPPEGSSTHNPE